LTFDLFVLSFSINRKLFYYW